MAKFFYAIFLLLLFMFSWASAQSPNEPVLLAKYDENTSITDIFTPEIKNQLKEIRAKSKKPSIFLALSAGLERGLKIRRQASRLFKELGFSDDQFEISHPQNAYVPKIERTEMWSFTNNKRPYQHSGVQDACIGGNPDPGIYGLLDIDPRTDRVFYEVGNIGWPLEFTEFKWTVTNGQVESGQGTRKIVVKTNRNDPSEIRLRLEVIYIDNLCLPSRVVNFTTRFRSAAEI